MTRRLLSLLFLVEGLSGQESIPNVAPALDGALIRDAKLVTPSSGWALVGQHLLWQSSGASWKDITPPGNSELDAVHFIDPNRGWAVLDKRDSTPDQVPRLLVAATTDGGATWTTLALG